MSLGKKIAETRKEKGLSQEALGRSIGVTAAFISQIETGVRNPSYNLLLKISTELDMSVESLISSDMPESNDPRDNLIALVSKSLTVDNKNKVIDYLYLITGSKKYFDLPFFSTPTEYAQYLLKRLKVDKAPIDLIEVAGLLGVSIIVSSDEVEFEGILYKCGDKPLIILNGASQYEPRRKFTIAMLLGHLIIPWHLQSVFRREKDKHSLEIDDKLGIEAREFAGALLLPPSILREDFKTIEPGLRAFEELAYNKYGSSLIVIGQKYVQTHPKTTALITSEKRKVTRSYGATFNYELSDRINEGSVAFTFFERPPVEKEIRTGVVSASSWFISAPNNLTIYEESLLDPKFGSIVTFLKTKK